MRTLHKKHRTQKQKQKRSNSYKRNKSYKKSNSYKSYNYSKSKRRGGGFFTYPSYYMQKAVSFFEVTPPVAYGNQANVKPFPYFQSK